jgi:hypothetical protein
MLLPTYCISGVHGFRDWDLLYLNLQFIFTDFALRPI